jgi:DNA-binding response OmpR family regulator
MPVAISLIDKVVKRQKNILLIESDLMVRQALGQALAVENYRVVSVQDQCEALIEFSSQPLDQLIDVVLLDLNPPNESAWETIDRLNALQPDLPVVGMTGRLEERCSIPAAPVFDALVEKPINLLLLLRTLGELTSETQSSQQPLLTHTATNPPTINNTPPPRHQFSFSPFSPSNPCTLIK